MAPSPLSPSSSSSSSSMSLISEEDDVQNVTSSTSGASRSPSPLISSSQTPRSSFATSSSSSLCSTLLFLLLLSWPCDDWSCSRPSFTLAAAATDEWSLTCGKEPFYGALNRSATLVCSLNGVNLLQDSITLSHVKWIKVG